MSQRKPLVFISHIGAEAEIAIGFKKLIESHFLKMMDFFLFHQMVKVLQWVSIGFPRLLWLWRAARAHCATSGL